MMTRNEKYRKFGRRGLLKANAKERCDDGVRRSKNP